MKYTAMGRTGTKISRACLGTMNFGASTNEKDSFKIMDRARELGINFFDVADFYGTPVGKGITESIVGNWIESSKQREQIVLTTKCYATMGEMEINDRGLSAFHVRRACDESLKRLKTDHIDLYFMHHYDRGVRSIPELRNIGREQEDNLQENIRGGFAPSFEEIIDVFQRLKDMGKISYIGSANFPGWAIAHFNGIARMQNRLGIVMEQSIYNLTNRNIECEVIPACRELGIGLMTYSPLAGGLLNSLGNLKKRTRINNESIRPMLSKLEKYEDLCNEIGETPSDVALAWGLHNKVVSSVILGPRTVQQLEESIRGIELLLPDDFLKAIDEIWRGPNGEAPEYYAW